MHTYIALFRGINVGGKNILPMKSLTAILEELGCRDIKTYIQSGNVILRHSNKTPNILAADIRKRIADTFNFDPHILLLRRDEFREAMAHNPFDTSNGKALHVFFLASYPASPNIDRLETLKTDSEQYRLYGKVFYLFAPDGIGRSKLAANIEKCLSVPATARNWNTIRKLETLLQQM